MICWIESVDPVDDLFLTKQIYSALLNSAVVRVKLRELKQTRLRRMRERHLKIKIRVALGSLSNHDDDGNKNPTNLHI